MHLAMTATEFQKELAQNATTSEDDQWLMLDHATGSRWVLYATYRHGDMEIPIHVDGVPATTTTHPRPGFAVGQRVVIHDPGSPLHGVRGEIVAVAPPDDGVPVYAVAVGGRKPVCLPIDALR